MIINKGITSSGWSWLVYHKDIGTGKYLKLNSTDSTTTNSASFSSVTSTTITNNSSNSSSDYINYCFIYTITEIDSFLGSGLLEKKYSRFDLVDTAKRIYTVEVGILSDKQEYLNKVLLQLIPMQ